MKYLIMFIFIFVLFNSQPVRADYITTNSFYIDADTTVVIDISGTLTASIDEDGDLSNSFEINFNIDTNEALSDIRLRAYARYGVSKTPISAFYCASSGSATSHSTCLAFANDDYPPELSAINNCKQATSTATSNPNAIAYSGNVTINNSGSITYESNGGDGYFACTVPTGTTDINMTLGTSAKSGTYDLSTSEDEDGCYKVEIYLDNIP